MTWFPWELRVTSDRTTILMPRNYHPRRIQEVIRQYGVTHILWGSFEPPPYYEINPESWAVELERLRHGPRSDRCARGVSIDRRDVLPGASVSPSVASNRAAAFAARDYGPIEGPGESFPDALVAPGAPGPFVVRRLVPRIRSGRTVRDGLGVNLWPATIGASEPLDCDEAAYAYIGHRILRGDVLYRDVTENKTPLGYWLYTLAVAVGGYNELAIRIMPIPFVLLTIALVWWIAGRLGGQLSACLAAGLYVLLSTDPYLFGNGANLEHFINLFSVASLALLIFAWDRTERWPLFAAGVCLGAAALVKQFAILPIVIFGPALLLRGRAGG